MLYNNITQQIDNNSIHKNEAKELTQKKNESFEEN